MGTWSSNPSVPHTGATFNFPANSTGANDIVYTITYTDDNGCTASTTYTVQKCCSTLYDLQVQNKAQYPSGFPIPLSGQSGAIGMLVFSGSSTTQKLPYSGLTKNDFYVETNGDGAAAITNYDVVWQIGPQYTIFFDMDGCSYYGKTAHIKIGLKTCIDAYDEFDVNIVGGQTYTININGIPSNETTMTIGLSATTVQCSANVQLNGTINKATGVTTGTCVSYSDEVTTSSLKVTSIHLPGYCQSPTCATITSINGHTINITYNPSGS